MKAGLKGWFKVVGFMLYMALLVFLIVDSFYTSTKASDEEHKRKVTLSFRHFWVDEHDLPVEHIFKNAIEQFELEHPNVKIKFEGIDQTIHREQKLKSEMVTGTQPDIFSLFGGGEIEPYVKANRLLDLTDFLEEKGLRDRFKDLSLWTFDGRVYGLPFEGNAEPLFYNKRIFADLGIAPPETIDELMEAVHILKEAGYTPFALSNKQRWPAGIYAHYLMDRYAGPQKFLEIIEGAASFENVHYEKAFRVLEEMVKAEAFPERANEWGAERAIRLFTEGKAGMYLNGSWDINLFQEGKAPSGFENLVGVIPFPAATSGGARSMAGGYTVGLGINADLREDEQEAALEFFEAIYSTELQQRLVYEALRIPAMSIPIDSTKTGSLFAQVVLLTEQAEHMFIPYDNMLSPEVKQMFLRVVAQMIDGVLEPKDALAELQSVAND